jgi:hypothetical protein
MDDTTIVRYTVSALRCGLGSNKVELFAPYGDAQQTPADAIASMQAAVNSNGDKYKLFRNSEGSHILIVDSRYIGTLAGIDMQQFASGGVFYDIFQRGLVLPERPTCRPLPSTTCTQCPCPATSL